MSNLSFVTVWVVSRAVVNLAPGASHEEWQPLYVARTEALALQWVDALTRLVTVSGPIEYFARDAITDGKKVFLFESIEYGPTPLGQHVRESGERVQSQIDKSRHKRRGA